MSPVDIEEYTKFVHKMISEPTKKLDKLVDRLEHVQNTNKCNVPSLMAGSSGLVCEAAELKDIVKKIIYQGKDLTPELLEHMKKELGDVAFYFVLMCLALRTSPSEVIQLNMDKINSRFESGKFSVDESENRKKGDV